MKGAERLIIDWKDFYGRTLPGAIVLVDIYALLGKTSIGDDLQSFVSVFLTKHEILFAITFVFISFVLGYITLSLNFYTYGRLFTMYPRELLMRGDFDPTTNERVLTYLKKQFGETKLKVKRGFIINYCRAALLKLHAPSYARLEKLESMRGASEGYLFAFLLTTAVAAVYGQLVLAFISVVFALVFAWELHRVTIARDRETLWLYYNAVVDAQPTGGQNT